MNIYRVGDVQTITIPLVNRSAATATNVIVTITLSEGLKYSTSTPSSGTVTTLSERDIRWSIPAVTASQSLTLQLSVEFTSTCNSSYTINWGVTSDQSEINTTNNTDCYTFTGFSCCQALQCLEVAKEDFVVTSGNTVVLSEPPLSILLVTVDGLETIEFTQTEDTIEFNTPFTEEQTVIVTFFKIK